MLNGKKKDEEIRQANLTAEEKEQERIKRLEELERTVAKNQADEKARQRLSEAKLPMEFAGFISDTQDDRAETKFKEFQAALTNYRESILKGVMKGDTPKQPKQSANQADNWRDRLTKNLKSIKEGE
ncbi:capsid assembly scaffolding protein Gp46 family protein [Enterococcus cecorum]|uniref:capsid assembly scaffolding protein Gp46 family protein n=1 Tax=Enterococcus cecorum TaxID=44008 RepID=UPI003265F444